MGELTRGQFLATEWTLRPLDGLDRFALLFIPYGLVGSINGAYVGNVATGNYSQNKKLRREFHFYSYKGKKLNGADLLSQPKFY